MTCLSTRLALFSLAGALTATALSVGEPSEDSCDCLPPRVSEASTRETGGASHADGAWALVDPRTSPTDQHVPVVVGPEAVARGPNASAWLLMLGPATLIPGLLSWVYLDRPRRVRYALLARAARLERLALAASGYRVAPSPVADLPGQRVWSDVLHQRPRRTVPSLAASPARRVDRARAGI